MGVKLKYLNKYINLEPIDKEYLFDYEDDKVKVEAFSFLFYISELKGILINLVTEIEENYFNNSSDYQYYMDVCLKKLEKSIEVIPTIDEIKIKGHFEFFKLKYIDFESMYLLSEGYWSYLYLGDDWLEPGTSPSGPYNAIEIQNDLYYFTKRKTVQIVKDLLKSHKSNQKRWFEVGLLFATGEMEKLRTEHDNNATNIAKQVFGENYKGYRPYISSSLGCSTKDEKNIFNNPKKIKEIYDYCIKKGISMGDIFKNKIKPNQT